MDEECILPVDDFPKLKLKFHSVHVCGWIPGGLSAKQKPMPVLPEVLFQISRQHKSPFQASWAHRTPGSADLSQTPFVL